MFVNIAASAGKISGSVRHVILRQFFVSTVIWVDKERNKGMIIVMYSRNVAFERKDRRGNKVNIELMGRFS